MTKTRVKKVKVIFRAHDRGHVGWRKVAQDLTPVLQYPVKAHMTAKRFKNEFRMHFG